jgi:hypothetical protein
VADREKLMEKRRQFFLARPGATTKCSRLKEAARFQLSALSPQLLNKFCDFSRFTEQNFFAKRKEVIDKDSISFNSIGGIDWLLERFLEAFA